MQQEVVVVDESEDEFVPLSVLKRQGKVAVDYAALMKDACTGTKGNKRYKQLDHEEDQEEEEEVQEKKTKSKRKFTWKKKKRFIRKKSTR
jgi:hypothetical protein